MNKKVLIIEDEENIIQLLTINLISEGYVVDFASDGMEGLKKIDIFNPDLIVLDIRLPKLNGWEICKKIKGNNKYKNISILIVTASAQRADMEKAFLMGVNDFLDKPFEMQILIDKIKELLK